MRIADDLELASWISRAQAEAFAQWLGVCVDRPHLAELGALMRAYLGKLPFQNVSMLARYGRAPSVAEILDDMQRGRGGPCNVMNPFLAAFLARLGYDVTLLSGSMQQPDCHIALAIRLEGRRYWVDAGNGHPYLEPIAFGDEAPRQHAGLIFRLATRGLEQYAVEHLFPDATAWKTSYTLSLAPRSLRFFAAMIEQHHTKPGFGPFLTGLRIVRFPDGARTAIRDDTLTTGRTCIRQTRLENRAALLAAIAEHFGDVDLPIGQALDALDRAGCSPLSHCSPLHGASP